MIRHGGVFTEGFVFGLLLWPTLRALDLLPAPIEPGVPEAPEVTEPKTLEREA